MSVDVEDFLEHYGVKGMRWGVRRAKAKKELRTIRQDKLYASRRTQTALWVGIHNQAADLANKHDVGRINSKKEYKGKNFNDPKNAALKEKYYKEHQNAFLKRVEEVGKKIEPNASGTQTYAVMIGNDGSWGVTLSDIVKHADDDEIIFTVKVNYDSMGRIISLLPSERAIEMSDLTEEFLSHYGVKGMRWGVRKDRASGVSRRTDRVAKKDAQEFARAKMFYGEGAGTRRKLIKAKVEQRSKQSPSYKKAFEQHLSGQDMGKHSDKARSERKRTDTKVKTKQRVGAVARRVTGEPGTQAAMVGIAAMGVGYLQSPRGRDQTKKVISSLAKGADDIRRRQGASHLRKYL